MTLHVLPSRSRNSLWTATWLLGAIAVGVILAFFLLPRIALGQTTTAPDADNIAGIASFVLGAIRLHDWSVVTFAGLVLVVSLVRRYASKIPKLAAFLATDPGGAGLTIATVVPLALLSADLAGQPVTWRIAWAALGGTLVVFTLLRKLVRPLLARIPGTVGTVLVQVLDFVSGVVAPRLPATSTSTT